MASWFQTISSNSVHFKHKTVTIVVRNNATRCLILSAGGLASPFRSRCLPVSVLKIDTQTYHYWPHCFSFMVTPSPENVKNRLRRWWLFVERHRHWLVWRLKEKNVEKIGTKLSTFAKQKNIKSWLATQKKKERNWILIGWISLSGKNYRIINYFTASLFKTYNGTFYHYCYLFIVFVLFCFKCKKMWNSDYYTERR